MFNSYKFTVSERFLRYAEFDTQSDPESKTNPSTLKQLELAKALVQELQDIGIDNAIMDENGYVYASLGSNSDKDVVPIGLLAHIDTADSVSAENVSPVVHQNYQGGNIVLPKDSSQIIRAEDLQKVIGHDLITTDGTTLLGADDKAGVAEIMDALNFLVQHPEVKHGDIKVCFNPDEEVARGTEKFDVQKFGAKFAYTLDAGIVGEVQNESFSADQVIITIHGHSTHPGAAKNKMINATKVASELISSLPQDKLAPEVTDNREGFIHCTNFNSTEETATLKFIIRDFDTDKLSEHESLLKKLAVAAIDKFPGATMNFEIKEQYRNMRYELDKYPEVMANAVEALKRLNIEPIYSPIRGGTDGSRLSYMGLPTPNLFAAQHNLHSKLEWTSIQEMELAVQTIITLCQIWEEQGASRSAQ